MDKNKSLFTDEEIKMIYDGQLIAAMKSLRNRTDMTIAEVKRAVTNAADKKRGSFVEHVAEREERERRESLLCLIKASILVGEFFHNRPEAASLWFETPNPLLGDITPFDYLEIKGAEALLDFVRGLLEEGVREPCDASEEKV